MCQSILINGGSIQNVKKALKQWIDLYQNDLVHGLSFELYNIQKGKHLIDVDKELSNEHFFYLINYLKYPEGIDYNIDITGYTKLENKESTPIQVFIPINDTEYDNIHYITEQSKAYKFDLGGNVSKVELKRPFTPLSENNLTRNLKAKFTTSKKISNEKNIDFRNENFIGGTRVSIFLFIITISCYFVFEQIFNFCYIAVSFCFAIWLHLDYKVLQRLDHFIKLLIFSIIISILPSFLTIETDKGTRFILELSAIMPFCYLLVQLPIRLLFKLLVNREPIIERPSPSFEDGLYAISLTILLFAFPLLAYNYMFK